jgi:hypothetical protein
LRRVNRPAAFLVRLTFVIGLPSSRHRPARRVPARRAAWVVVCLWLLVALVPLRAWATAGMVVAMADGPAAAAFAAQAELPPCHAAAHDDAAPEGEHRACAQCVFCAPVLAPAVATDDTPPCAADAPPAALAGDAPEGVRDALFRPPRG